MNPTDPSTIWVPFINTNSSLLSSCKLRLCDQSAIKDKGPLAGWARTMALRLRSGAAACVLVNMLARPAFAAVHSTAAFSPSPVVAAAAGIGAGKGWVHRGGLALRPVHSRLLSSVIWPRLAGGGGGARPMKTGVEPPADPSGDTLFGKIIRGEIPCDKVRGRCSPAQLV